MHAVPIRRGVSDASHEYPSPPGDVSWLIEWLIKQEEFMADIRREETRDEGLTTATLANLEERETSNLDRDYDRQVVEAERQRVGNSATSTAAFASNASKQVTPNPANEDQPTPLFSSQEATDLHARWDAIQVGFVDEPRQAVEQADSLVAGAMKRLAEGFAEERARLEGQWDRGDSVSTEDLRLALRRYRSFFGRLLSV
jgi:hypothetical protein